MDSQRIRPGDMVRLKADMSCRDWVVVRHARWGGKVEVSRRFVPKHCKWIDNDRLWVYPTELLLVTPVEPFVQLEVAEE